MKIYPSLRQWFASRRAAFKAVTLDIDGCLMVSRKPVPGAVAFVEEVRSYGLPVAVLTNDGDHSVAEKNHQLADCGFRFAASEITSCSHGIEDFACRHHLQGQRFFVMGALGRPDYARLAGLRVTRSLKELDRCAGVIVGEGENRYAWESVLNAVFNMLLRCPDKPLVVPNPDEFFPVKNGELRIAAGSIARYLQRLLAVRGQAIEPVYLGKPHRPIFEHSHAALERRAGCRVAPCEVLMVGDSLASDVLGAVRFGYAPVLLLTGVESAASVRKAEVLPRAVCRGF